MIDPEEPIIVCDKCGCDEWIALTVTDYPLVVCWQCKNCGNDM